LEVDRMADEPCTGADPMIGIRAPADLKQALQEAADEADRSLAAECVRRLRRSFDPHMMVDDAVALLVQENGMLYQGEEVFTFILDALSNVFGHEATEVAATMAHVLGMMLQSEMDAQRRGPSAAKIRVVIPKYYVHRLKESVAKIERECIVMDDEEYDKLYGVQITKVQEKEAETSEKPSRPPHLLVRDAMVSRIAAGEWKPNAPIPSESDLAREFGVSPETVREALDIMEGERLLRRRALDAVPSRKRGATYLVASSPGAPSS
jgi:regulatory GntR family protein